MKLIVFIILVIIIILMLYIFTNASGLHGKYPAIKTDEEILYYLKSYPECHNISAYKDALTYVFLHTDAIIIEIEHTKDKISLNRVGSCFYLNGRVLSKSETTTENLWGLINFHISTYPPSVYSINIIYSHEDINPSPIQVEDGDDICY